MHSSLHSSHEIISRMGKTWQGMRRKQKQCQKLFIHINNESASDKRKNVSLYRCTIVIFRTSLFEFNLILFKMRDFQQIVDSSFLRIYCIMDKLVMEPLNFDCDRVSRIINCTVQIFAQAYKTRRIPGHQGTSVI